MVVCVAHADNLESCVEKRDADTKYDAVRKSPPMATGLDEAFEDIVLLGERLVLPEKIARGRQKRKRAPVGAR